MKKAVKQLKSFKEHKSNFESLREEFRKGYQVDALNTSFVGLYNTYECMKGNKMRLPDFITPEIEESLKEAAGRDGIFSFYTKEICSLSIGRFVKDVMDNIESFVQSPNSAARFCLYSGHDNTISPIIHGLEIADGYHPPMGSTIVFELWEDISNHSYHVRILFNNEIKVNRIRYTKKFKQKKLTFFLFL